MADDFKRPSGPAKRGLLYRLSVSPHPEQPIPVVDAIVHNLRALLNSDRGISASSPTLGVSLHKALTQWDTARPAVVAEIAALIAEYEPRLEHVKVEALKEKSSTLRFALMITATLSDGTLFKARTAVGAAGGTEVEQVVADL